MLHQLILYDRIILSKRYVFMELICDLSLSLSLSLPPSLPLSLSLSLQEKSEVSYVGYANLPNQVFRKAVKKGFQFSLMVVGMYIFYIHKYIYNQLTSFEVLSV